MFHHHICSLCDVLQLEIGAASINRICIWHTCGAARLCIWQRVRVRACRNIKKLEKKWRKCKKCNRTSNRSKCVVGFDSQAPLCIRECEHKTHTISNSRFLPRCWMLWGKSPHRTAPQYFFTSYVLHKRFVHRSPCIVVSREGMCTSPTVGRTPPHCATWPNTSTITHIIKCSVDRLCRTLTHTHA